MGFLDNPFGGLFDFNRDGHTDMFEAGLGFAIMQDLFEDDEEEFEAEELEIEEPSEEEIQGDGGARIGDLEDLQTQLDELNDRLFNLELAEPGDFFSAAHDRWAAQRDELTDQIQELEDQIALLD